MNKTNCIEGMQEAFDRLVTVYDECSTDIIPVVDDGDFELLANVFFETQAEHLRAVKALLGAKRFISARILGRVMFEGMVFLFWVNQDRRDRAMKWRAWSAVTDFRLLRQKDAEDVPVEEKQRQRILRRAEEVRHLFARSKPKNSDPFVFSWRPKMWQMLNELPGEASVLKELYFPIYGLESQMVHWTIAGTGALLDKNGDSYRFVADRPSNQVIAMNSAFHAAWHVISNCATWFGIELDDRLNSIIENYVAHAKNLNRAR